jgi:multicomponent Na+:H+ antiporter subunit E
MPLQILLNLGIAFIWMFFHNTYDGGTFFIGYLIGMGLIFALRRFLPQKLYFGKVIPIVRLIILFFKELILSSISVAKEILRPKLNIRPGILAVPTKLKSDFEVTLFACLISLTPGTLTLEVSPEGDVLYIHCMDILHVEDSVNQIKNTFEKAIMEVSR